VNLVDVLRRNASTGVADLYLDAGAVASGYTQRPTASGHGIFGVDEKVEKHLLQLAGVPVDQRQVFIQAGFQLDSRSLELVLQQIECLRDDLVDIDIAKLGGAGAGKIQQVVYDLRGTESLASDLVGKVGEPGVAIDVFGKQLRIAGDHSQRRVYLMG